MELQKATVIANEIIEYLRPACERIEPAGSVRRKKPDVGDIEIVAKPKFQPHKIDSITKSGKAKLKAHDELTERVNEAIREGRLKHGEPNEEGMKPHFGPKYKRLAYPDPYVQVDLFCVTPPAEWGVIYTIRTGSANYTKWLMTRALQKGMKVEDGRLWDMSMRPRRLLPCPEERDFFKWLRVPWLEPEQRT
jgi:DNA polymerase/3'-5' exonuclease PolX